MNLRKELDNQLDTYGISVPNGYFITDNLINLFKRWALECVGEDDKIEDSPALEILPYSFGEASIDLVNDTKEEIRKRIEEAIK